MQKLLLPIYRGESGGSEKIRNLPKLTQAWTSYNWGLSLQTLNFYRPISIIIVIALSITPQFIIVGIATEKKKKKNPLSYECNFIAIADHSLTVWLRTGALESFQSSRPGSPLAEVSSSATEFPPRGASISSRKTGNTLLLHRVAASVQWDNACKAAGKRERSSDGSCD